MIGERYKILKQKGKYELYDLIGDPTESTNLIETEKEVAQEWIAAYEAWNGTVEDSVAGKDYPSGSVDPDQPERRFWLEDPAYQDYLDEFWKRPEYANWKNRAKKLPKK